MPFPVCHWTEVKTNVRASMMVRMTRSRHSSSIRPNWFVYQASPKREITGHAWETQTPIRFAREFTKCPKIPTFPMYTYEAGCNKSTEIGKLRTIGTIFFLSRYSNFQICNTDLIGSQLYQNENRGTSSSLVPSVRNSGCVPRGNSREWFYRAPGIYGWRIREWETRGTRDWTKFRGRWQQYCYTFPLFVFSSTNFSFVPLICY